jgi:hypothetical protein
MVLTPGGQRNESTQLEAVLDGTRVMRPGKGRQRKQPDRLIADPRATSTIALPEAAKEAQHQAHHSRTRRAGRAACPPWGESAELGYEGLQASQGGRAVYEQAQAVGRGVATRYKKRAANYRAVVLIAALMIWLAS